MNINVLLVDDEQDFIESLAERLALRNFNVRTATDGLVALEKVREFEFDVIILDVQMPGKSGIETLKEIKEVDQLVQILMLTGHGTINTAIEGMKLGAFDYLMKPTETKELINKIKDAYVIVTEHRDRIRRAEIDTIIRKRGW